MNLLKEESHRILLNIEYIQCTYGVYSTTRGYIDVFTISMQNIQDVKKERKEYKMCTIM